ncbi:MAG TPA: phosphatidylserine decarboxylase [Firmicutes bacterium]|nr:phosphatidylserine decarboxylase [Bacillota bacterium]
MAQVTKSVLTVLIFLATCWAATLWYLRRVWFYRDPKRTPPDNPRAILAPADGIVVYVKRFSGGKVESNKNRERIPLSEITKCSWGEWGEGWLLGIYMSPLDVHFNYAPISGEVVKIVHTPAKLNLPMVDLWEYVKLTYLRKVVDLFSHRFRLQNERNTIFLSGQGITLAMVEIADKFVNKIRCFVKEGQHVTMGEKMSFIERGSQVDLVIPADNVRMTVKTGDRVVGGETIVAISEADVERNST